VVQYRLGQHNEALATLAVSDAHYTEEQGGTPQDVAFIAMAHHQLGQQEEALAAMERLRALMRKPQHARDDECRAFLTEAESLILTSDSDQPNP
jgi:thioredoxin-like negative regulator of GroEL